MIAVAKLKHPMVLNIWMLQRWHFCLLAVFFCPLQRRRALATTFLPTARVKRPALKRLVAETGRCICRHKKSLVLAESPVAPSKWRSGIQTHGKWTTDKTNLFRFSAGGSNTGTIRFPCVVLFVRVFFGCRCTTW